MAFSLRRKEPRAGGRDPFYSPERDLGIVGLPLVQSAMYALDPDRHDPWFRAYMESNELTLEDLQDGAKKFALAMNQIIPVKTAHDALKDAGFLACHPGVQLAFYAKIGQVMLSAVWVGVKDMHAPGNPPPLEVQELLAMVEAQFDALQPPGGGEPPTIEPPACGHISDAPG